MTFKKGDRVSWHADDKSVYPKARPGSTAQTGVVYQRKAKHPRVANSGALVVAQGDFAVTIPEAWAFAAEPLPPEPPDPMTDYTVTGYKEIKGHGDSATFHCTIRHKGKPVLEALNSGWGGPNDYRAYQYRSKIGMAGQEESDNIHAAAKAWFEHHGYAGVMEPVDLWIEWYVTERPTGKTAAQYVAEFKASMEEYRK